jgi:hypothetical protein
MIYLKKIWTCLKNIWSKINFKTLDKNKLIIAAAIIIAAIIYANFNPYASCKRDIKKAYPDVTGQVLALVTADECGK